MPRVASNWPWPEPPLLKPLRPLAGSGYIHPSSSVPLARAGGVLRISILGHRGLALDEPDGRETNDGRPRGLHFWERLRIG